MKKAMATNERYCEIENDISEMQELEPAKKKMKRTPKTFGS